MCVKSKSQKVKESARAIGERGMDLEASFEQIFVQNERLVQKW